MRCRKIVLKTWCREPANTVRAARGLFNAVKPQPIMTRRRTSLAVAIPALLDEQLLDADVRVDPPARSAINLPLTIMRPNRAAASRDSRLVVHGTTRSRQSFRLRGHSFMAFVVATEPPF